MNDQIYPCLWFNGHAGEAAAFYCTVFPDCVLTNDTAQVATMTAAGRRFMLLNGGPEFKPNASVSFFVVYETKAEVDAAWEKLLEGGSVLMPLDAYPWSERYGWVQDRFGVNWQLSFGKLSDVGQQFVPSLLFTGNRAGRAEEAIHYYTTLFQPSSITGILRYGANEGEPESHVKHAQFTLAGNVFMAMDSSQSHPFGFSEGVSLVVECENQEEIDHYWAKLTEGGAESQCGWLKDRFGLSWQIIPAKLREWMSDSRKAPRVMEAFLPMKKMDLSRLQEAAEAGEPLEADSRP